MQHNSSSTTAIIIAALLVVPCLVTTADAQDDTAPKFAARQIADLSAWRTAAPREALENNKEKWGSTAAFQTAWGVLLSHEGKLDEGVKTLKKAADMDKNNPAADFFRGNALYWQKKYDNATSAWQRSFDRASNFLEKHPKNPSVRFYEGAALVGLARYGDARVALNKAADFGFNPAMTHYQIGLSYYFQKKWNEAKNAFDKVIEKDDRYAYAYYYRARTWSNLDRKDAMLVDLDQFVKLAPNAPDASKAKGLLAASGR